MTVVMRLAEESAEPIPIPIFAPRSVPAHHIDSIHALVIDDSVSDVEIIRRLAASSQDASFIVDSAGSIEEAESMMEKVAYDVLLLDHRLPREDGLAFLERTRGTLEAPAVMLTGEDNARIAVAALRIGAYDYLPKDSLSSDLLSLTLQEAVWRFRDEISQQAADERALVARAASVETTGEATGHLRRMAFYASQIGLEIGLKGPQLSALRLGAVLHDIGTLAVRTSIFRKKGPLTRSEWADMKRHPIVSEALCSPLRLVREVSPIVRHHHERWDGKGYPDGLREDAIPMLARIISVVDAFDAMISGRPYRSKLLPEDAMRQLSQGSGTQWDPDLTDRFMTILTNNQRDILREAQALPVESGPDALWDEVQRSRIPAWPGGQ